MRNFQSRKTSGFESSNICISDNRMLDFFFDENDFDERNLNDRGNADDESKIESKVESEDVKYAFRLDCLNF